MIHVEIPRAGSHAGHLRLMTNSVLPNAWTWADEEGCDHMVVAGTVLRLGHGRKPSFEALCGHLVPIRELLLRQRFMQCSACLNRLSDLIATALDDAG